MAGKGSHRRPRQITEKEEQENWDNIDWRKDDRRTDTEEGN